MTSFLVFAGGYAYNNTRDVEEDLINRKNISPLAPKRKGLVIVTVSLISGIFFSLFLSTYSIVLIATSILTLVVYSFLKLKKYLLLKNVYTAFCIALSFLIGAASSGLFTLEITIYYCLVVFFLFIGSLISDMRDYEGDKKAGIRTLPVHLGYERTRNMVCALLVVGIPLVLIFSKFMVFIPVILMTVLAVLKNRPGLAHALGGLSFVLLMLIALIF
ncbi:MAG: UbiA family prenyltransferase [Candidatus Aenigmarchaeota archaeon]|nr:UbiA family prenyltransferase [Candidatus Aenigmarchaeota archaeon]